MRRKTPENVFLNPDLADVQAIGIEVLDLSQLSGINKFFKLDDCGMILKDMAHHEDQLVVLCQFHEFLSLFYGQRERFFHENVFSGKKAFLR